MRARCTCVGGMAIVGTLRGELLSHTARDPTLVGRESAHNSAVSALVRGAHTHTHTHIHTHCNTGRSSSATLSAVVAVASCTCVCVCVCVCVCMYVYLQDVGHVAATGVKLVLSTSADRLCVHEVLIRTSMLRLLAQVRL